MATISKHSGTWQQPEPPILDDSMVEYGRSMRCAAGELYKMIALQDNVKQKSCNRLQKKDQLQKDNITQELAVKSFFDAIL